jgi:DNA-binding response OmpR family regulator
MADTKILIVDDEFAVRYLVERHLAKHDFDVLLARDGESGVQLARDHEPDAILLDVNLPDMDGYMVCEQLRMEPTLHQTPILFMSSYCTPERKQRAFDAGATDYIEKPFVPDEFMSRITAVIQESREAVLDLVENGRITVFYGPKGGVGTTTLAVQFSEATVIHAERPVMLIDLALPLGGIAPLLNLFTYNNIVGLLEKPIEQLTIPFLKEFAQQQHNNLYVLPAPGTFLDTRQAARSENLCPLLEILTQAGIEVIIDAGSHLTPLTMGVLRRAHTIFAITTGHPVANRMLNGFIDSAEQLRLSVNRIMPVINEINGHYDGVELTRMPVSIIPHTNERSRTRLWLQENGIRKMVSIAVPH